MIDKQWHDWLCMYQQQQIAPFFIVKFGLFTFSKVVVIPTPFEVVQKLVGTGRSC